MIDLDAASFMDDLTAAKAASVEAMKGMPTPDRWVPVEKDENGDYKPIIRTHIISGWLCAVIEAETKFEGRDRRRLARERRRARQKTVRDKRPDESFTITWE